ncbi:hypothetical protein WMF18_15690 [Sorangium sp. So ce315]|uniref:hypothetical protein n=1 Tax=Sorangium sp. So ce315 TaxID=3133299 RepID=UPI003F623BE2
MIFLLPRAVPDVAPRRGGRPIPVGSRSPEPRRGAASRDLQSASRFLNPPRRRGSLTAASLASRASVSMKELLMKTRLIHVLPALTSLIIACAAPSSTELQIDESATAGSPLSVRASASTHEALRIASWSVSGTGDARTFVGLDDAEAPVATLTIQPERHERGARLLVEVDTEATSETLTLTADGAVTGGGSARAVALASALYGDLKAFDASGGARPSDPLTSADGEQIGTATDALTYSCGATINRGDWVRCGTVFLGETSICITNNTGSHGIAYVDWFKQDFGVYPYDRTCAYRWFWGADVYVNNKSAPGVALTVSH